MVGDAMSQAKYETHKHYAKTVLDSVCIDPAGERMTFSFTRCEVNHSERTTWSFAFPAPVAQRWAMVATVRGISLAEQMLQECHAWHDNSIGIEELVEWLTKDAWLSSKDLILAHHIIQRGDGDLACDGLGLEHRASPSANDLVARCVSFWDDCLGIGDEERTMLRRYYSACAELRVEDAYAISRELYIADVLPYSMKELPYDPCHPCPKCNPVEHAAVAKAETAVCAHRDGGVTREHAELAIAAAARVAGAAGMELARALHFTPSMGFRDMIATLAAHGLSIAHTDIHHPQRTSGSVAKAQPPTRLRLEFTGAAEPMQALHASAVAAIRERKS